MSRKEHDYWIKSVREETEIPMAINAYNDSVAELERAGLAIPLDRDSSEGRSHGAYGAQRAPR